MPFDLWFVDINLSCISSRQIQLLVKEKVGGGYMVVMQLVETISAWPKKKRKYLATCYYESHSEVIWKRRTTETRTIRNSTLEEDCEQLERKSSPVCRT
jgi:hypothetical protein